MDKVRGPQRSRTMGEEFFFFLSVAALLLSILQGQLWKFTLININHYQTTIINILQTILLKQNILQTLNYIYIYIPKCSILSSNFLLINIVFQFK